MKQTNKDLTIDFLPSGANEVFTRSIFVPKGTKVNNFTAMGPDEHYHYVSEPEFTNLIADGEPVTKKPELGLYWDLKHHGINIPVEHIEYNEQAAANLVDYFQRLENKPVELLTTWNVKTQFSWMIREQHIFGYKCRWHVTPKKTLLFVFV